MTQSYPSARKGFGVQRVSTNISRKTLILFSYADVQRHLQQFHPPDIWWRSCHRVLLPQIWHRQISHQS